MERLGQMAKKLLTGYSMQSGDQTDASYDFDLDEAIRYLSEAIQQRQTNSGVAASDAERGICIEVRCVFLAFRDFSLVRGFDERLARRVETKLHEALGYLTADEVCRGLVQRRIDVDFNDLVSRMRGRQPSSLMA
jgi:hypothetical protein